MVVSGTGRHVPLLGEGWQASAAASVLRTLALSLIVIVGAMTSTFIAESAGALTAAMIGYIVVWAVIFVFYLRWQVRGIRSAQHPVIRGVETLLVGTVLYVSIFAKAYYVIAVNDPAAFSETVDHFDSYYYTVTVLSTVGFGDITPVTTIARAVTMAQMVLNLALLAVTVRLVTAEVKRAHTARRSAAQDG